MTDFVVCLRVMGCEGGGLGGAKSTIIGWGWTNSTTWLTVMHRCRLGNRFLETGLDRVSNFDLLFLRSRDKDDMEAMAVTTQFTYRRQRFWSWTRFSTLTYQSFGGDENIGM